MKANLKNLKEVGYIKAYLGLMEFGEEVGFFKRENGQRIQNMSCELSTDEFKEQYQKYLDTPIIKDGDMDEIGDTGFYLLMLKETSNDSRKVAIVYNPYTQEIYERVAREVKSKGSALCVKVNNEWIEINS